MCRQNPSSRLPRPPDTISVPPDQHHDRRQRDHGNQEIFQIGVPRTGFLSASGTAAISRTGIRGPVDSRKVVVQLSEERS